MTGEQGTGLSKTQEPVVLDPRPRILVSAAAGSGKTRLLVAYFVRALLEEGIPADRLVAVTFTRKAAAELADRIRCELRLRGRSDLAWSLDAATIGTIHALCRRLITDRALEVGVDPACSVLEAEAAALVKQETGREAWERVAEDADEVELEVLASGRDGLRRQIGPLYDRLRGLGYDQPQVTIAPGPPPGWARDRLVEAIDRALAAVRVSARPGSSLQADVDRLRACLQWLEDRMSDEERAARLAETLDFFPSRRTRSMEADFEPVREALTQYRSALAELRLRPLVSTVNRLLMEFHQRYEARKRERGMLDFTDLELRARALVSGRGGAGASDPVLPGCWVLIDEFQDTNEVQCSILEGLGATRLLMVGDYRQSIYRFRGADVQVFRKREEELGSKAADDPAGTLYRLDTNYRSRKEILDFVNRLFAHPSYFGADFKPLLPPDPEEEPAEAADITARPAPRPAPSTGGPATTTVYPGRAPSAPARPAVASRAGGAAVEVLVAERGVPTDPAKLLLSIPEAEARVVAARIRSLIHEEGYLQRDIVVLLPAYTYVDIYRRALLAAGLQVYVVRGKGYYTQEEVADIVSLLRLLVSPHDDLAMVAALRSPLVGISDDALYHLGRQKGKDGTSLWDVVRSGKVAALGHEDRMLLEAFAVRLDGLRRRVGRPGLARLIDEAVSICAYDRCLLASPDGMRRFANVGKLMRMARDFEALEGPDLAGFVELIASMGDLSDQEGSAPTLAEGDDVVRLMTIHQAKGLEFPVVVLAGLGSDVFHGETPDVVVGDDGRMAAFLKGSKRENYEAYDLSWGPGAEVVAQGRERENEEDVRLLYVAMTRTQQRLILIGARPVGERLDGSRIGRTIVGLGLQGLPAEGESATLDGLDAVVASIPVVGSGALPAPARLQMKAGGAPDGEGRGMSAELPSEPPSEPPSESPRESGPESLPEFLMAAPRAGVPHHLSFSALAAYQRCPRRFYLERMLGLDREGIERGDDDEADGAPPPGDLLLDPDERQTGRDVGLLTHALLERLPVGDGPPAEESVRREADAWLLQTGVELSPADVERAVALTLAFWKMPAAGTWSHPAAAREAHFFFARGDALLSGVMDLVLRDDECWHIIDYKTNALAGRAPAELMSSYELQAIAYCLAALLAGAPAVQMDFVFLEDPAEPQTRRFGRGDIPRLESSLDGVLGDLGRREFPAGTSEECARCPVAWVCGAVARP